MKKYLPAIFLSFAFVILLMTLSPTIPVQNQSQPIPILIPTTTPAVISTSTPTVVAKSEKQLGYIKKAYTKDNKNYIDIDYVQWIDDATQPNHFRIDNVNPLIRTFEVVETTPISIISYSISGEMTSSKIKFNQFVESIKANTILCNIEINGNMVTNISERYVP